MGDEEVGGQAYMRVVSSIIGSEWQRTMGLRTAGTGITHSRNPGIILTQNDMGSTQVIADCTWVTKGCGALALEPEGFRAKNPEFAGSSGFQGLRFGGQGSVHLVGG